MWIYCGFYGTGLAVMNLIFICIYSGYHWALAVTVEFAGLLYFALALSRKLLDVVWALLACAGILLIVPWKNDHVDLLGLGLAFPGWSILGIVYCDGEKWLKLWMEKMPLLRECYLPVWLLFFTVWDGAVFNITPIIFLKGLGCCYILSSALPFFSLEMVALKKLPAKPLVF